MRKRCEYTFWLVLSFLPTTRHDAAPGLPDTKRTSINVRLEKQASLRNWWCCCCVTSLFLSLQQHDYNFGPNSPRFELPHAALQRLTVNWSKQEVGTANGADLSRFAESYFRQYQLLQQPTRLHTH